MQTLLQHDTQSIVDSFTTYDKQLQEACEEFACELPTVLLVSPPYLDPNTFTEKASFPESS